MIFSNTFPNYNIFCEIVVARRREAPNSARSASEDDRLRSVFRADKRCKARSANATRNGAERLGAPSERSSLTGEWRGVLILLSLK